MMHFMFKPIRSALRVYQIADTCIGGCVDGYRIGYILYKDGKDFMS